MDFLKKNWKEIGAVVVIFCLGMSLVDRSTLPGPLGKKSKSNAKEVTWELLYKLDYETGEAPKELRKMHGERVRIAGYVVPLSDNLKELDEFLLVPDGQSCIHVPPPPPNLIIQAKLNRTLPMEEVFNPAWIEGVIRIEEAKSKFGSAGYQMEVDVLEEYVFESY